MNGPARYFRDAKQAGIGGGSNDQLDTLAKQVDIYDLEQVYNELVMRVERLQDLMDDF